MGLFNKYVSDNSFALTGVGIVATVAGIFLNLDPVVFPTDLRSLQFLILLLLIFSLLFLTINSIFWIFKETKNELGIVIAITLSAVLFDLFQFIASNFQEELKSYLKITIFVVLLIIWSFLSRLRNKFFSYCQKNSTKNDLILRTSGSFAFVYVWIVSTSLYSNLAFETKFDWMIFIKPFLNHTLVIFGVWMFVINVWVTYSKPRRNFRDYIWIAFIFSPTLAYLFYLSVPIYYYFTN